MTLGETIDDKINFMAAQADRRRQSANLPTQCGLLGKIDQKITFAPSTTLIHTSFKMEYR